MQEQITKTWRLTVKAPDDFDHEPIMAGGFNAILIENRAVEVNSFVNMSSKKKNCKKN